MAKSKKQPEVKTNPAAIAEDVIAEGQRNELTAEQIAQKLNDAGADVALAASFMIKDPTTAPSRPGKLKKLAGQISKLTPKAQALIGDVLEGKDALSTKKQDLQSKIAEASRNIKQQSDTMAHEQGKIDDMISLLPSWARVAKLEAELAEAREDLKKQELDSAEIDDAKHNMAETKSLKKHYTSVLSMLLVQWATTFKRRDVTVSTQRLEIIISAKLGKVVDDLQMELPLWDVTE